MKTVAEAYGAEAANDLAMIAIDLLCDPPARLDRATTRVSSRMVKRGRQIMDRAGIDWRELVGDGRSARARDRKDEDPAEAGPSPTDRSVDHVTKGRP